MVYGVTWGEGDGPGGSSHGSSIVKTATSDVIADSSGGSFATTVSLTNEIMSVGVGDAVRIMARGIFSTFGSGGTLGISVNGIIDTGSQTVAANLVDRGWWLEGVIVQLASGSNGQGTFAFSNSARLWEAMDMENGANSLLNINSGSIQITVAWGTADPANSINLRQLIVEKITNG